MSFFYTSATLHHITPIPTSITFDEVISALNDHDLLIKGDPEYSHHEELPRDKLEKPFTAPLDSKSTRRWKCTDHMPNMPKGLGLPTTVNFEAEITNIDNGLDWIVKAPMGMVQTTTWRVVKRSEAEGTKEQINELVDDGGELALVEDVKIEANRLLVSTVKNKCEGNWRGIQKAFVEELLKRKASTG